MGTTVCSRQNHYHPRNYTANGCSQCKRRRQVQKLDFYTKGTVNLSTLTLPTYSLSLSITLTLSHESGTHTHSLRARQLIWVRNLDSMTTMGKIFLPQSTQSCCFTARGWSLIIGILNCGILYCCQSLQIWPLAHMVRERHPLG